MPSSASNAEDSQDPAAAKERSWAAAGMAARRTALQQLFVERARTAALAKVIDKVRADRDALSEPTCVLIIGETGAGKSAFLQRYAKRHPKRREGGSLVQPVIYEELQSKTTIVAAAKGLLRKLEDPSAGRGNLADQTYRVTQQLIAQRVEAVIIDEMNHIVETGMITVNKVADWFKQVAKASNVPFVMAGTPASARIVNGHQQFAAITPYRLTLDRFDWDTSKGRAAFREFLARVDAELPFDGVAGLADKEWAEALYNAAAGWIRPLMRLIKEAAIDALECGSANIGRDHLAYGYEHIYPADPNAGNPFGPALPLVA